MCNMSILCKICNRYKNVIALLQMQDTFKQKYVM